MNAIDLQMHFSRFFSSATSYYLGVKPHPDLQCVP